MPIVPFDTLPDASRVWIFGADRPVTGAAAERLLAAVDDHLARWAAHGAPLRSGRDWREDRFLTIAVDQSTAGASGCSIDGLFRTLQRLEPELDASLVGGGRVFVRGPDGRVRLTTRPELRTAVRDGTVTAETPVFDLTITTLGDWRARFEAPAAATWTAALVQGG